MSTSVRPRPSPLNSPRSSPCSSPRGSPRFSRKHIRSPTVKKHTMPVLVVHGGAGAVPLNKITLKIDGVKRATNKGYEVLLSPEGNALDAVEAAVRVMEDDYVFNAGYGSSLTINGDIEMDALVMEGTRMRAGAVGGVTGVPNPVTLAKKIMEKTDHVFMIKDGAQQFAQQMGLPVVPTEKLITDWSRERLSEYKTFTNTVNQSINANDHDTVGAVAVDSLGRVACATSTGGLTGKLNGRVGDTPLIGSGGFADDFVGAVSTTGHGEAIMRVCLSRHITGLMQQGMNAQDAVIAGLEHMKNRVQGYGGAIAVSNFGDVGIYFTTTQMSWAYRKGNILHYGILPGERRVEDVVEVDSSP
ncbi:isoaspartyl peptidase/L-asparaginase-like isoform X2 [Centruroides sculpturatus]|uniref:isoaspartyl peptidase/L-asparaginase-like isoform X2 n=1 Tax=Centruroides sculpturatus TaxID=218467 RepID=UPI000C6E1383|nr:isoaspartyl peptidase/L-asparaginase-like isoform X2 [Centruroides sculpturatus]